MKKLMIFVFVFLVVSTLFSATDIKDEKATKFATWLKEKGINPYLIVLLLAMLPIFELRGSIPVGIFAMKLDIVPVIIYSIIGNMLPIFFILLFLKPIEKILRNIAIFNRFFDWLFARTKAKSATIEKYEELGLMLFVGIPLPLTGAWTGALAAYIFSLSYVKSIIFIFLGVLLAAIIVTTLTLIWQIGIVILALAVLFFIYVSINAIIKSIRQK